MFLGADKKRIGEEGEEDTTTRQRKSQDGALLVKGVTLNQKSFKEVLTGKEEIV